MNIYSLQYYSIKVYEDELRYINNEASESNLITL